MYTFFAKLGHPDVRWPIVTHILYALGILIFFLLLQLLSSFNSPLVAGFISSLVFLPLSQW
jgi:hypothetical protein